MEQSHLPTAAFRAGSQSSEDQTLHMKVHCYQLQLSFHLLQLSPPPLALQMGAWPPPYVLPRWHPLPSLLNPPLPKLPRD